MFAKHALILTTLVVLSGCTSVAHRDQDFFRTHLPSLRADTVAPLTWKTYDSKLSTEFKGIENPFSFQFPANWIVATEGRGFIAIQSVSATYPPGEIEQLPVGQFRIEIVPERETRNGEGINGWCRKYLTNTRNNEYISVDVVNQQEKIIGGYPAYVIDSRPQGANQEIDRQVCIAKGDTKMMIVGYPVIPQYLPVFNQVLSTLRFGEE